MTTVAMTRPKPWFSIVILAITVFGTLAGLSMGEGIHVGGDLIFFAICSPVFISELRNHHNRLAICVLTYVVLFGVTLTAFAMTKGNAGVLEMSLALVAGSIAWFVAFIWSFTRVKGRADRHPA